MLGIIYLQDGDHGEAETLFRQAIASNTKVDAYYINLVNCLRGLGKVEDALAILDKRLSHSPRNPAILNSVGVIYAEQGRFEEAIPLFRKCMKFEPKNVSHKVNLAKALRESEEIDEALAVAKHAVTSSPGTAEAQNELGLVYQVLGEMDLAGKHFLKAISLNHALTEAYSNLSACRRFTPHDREITDLFENELKTPNLPHYQSSNLHFALGKIYDDLGEWANAFRHFELANRQKHIRFNRAEFARQVNNIISVYDREFFDKFPASEQNRSSPIFITGMPRSGTTLTEQILSTSDQVIAIGEKQYIPDITRNMSADLGVTDSYPQCMNHLSRDDIINYSHSYENRALKQSDQSLRSIDKMTSNFLHLGLISLMFPNAKLIHCTRDPIDNGLSCFFQNFSNGVEFSYDLHDIAFYYHQYRKIMAHWEAVLPIPVFELNYRDLIEHQQEKIHELVNFCELDWDDKFLTPQKSKRAVYTASNWQVRQNIYSSSMDRWQNYRSYIKSFIDEINDESDTTGRPSHGKTKTGLFRKIFGK